MALSVTGLRLSSVPLPSRGEVWTANLHPHIGHERGGFRPALVVSVNDFNHGPAQMVIVVPLTTRSRRIASYVPLEPPEGGVKARCFAKCEDVRSISTLRLVDCRGEVAAATMAEVEDRLRMLLSL